MQLNDFRAHLSAFYCELSYAHRQLESPRPRAARIEVKNSVTRFRFRNMTMAGDHHLESRSFRLEIKLRQIVQHVDRDATKFNHCSLRQFSRPGIFVDIASHSRNGRDAGECFQNFR